MKAGIYDIAAEQYHRDLTSLSSTGARQIVNDCPAAFRYAQDNLEKKREFDIGTATHLLVLEPERFADRVVIVKGYTKKGDYSPGYQTDDARAQRDAAYAACKTPLLPEELDLVRNMREAIQAHPIASQAFKNGEAEKSLFWQCPEFGIMCRTRPDYLPTHSRYMVDLKTSASADPEDFAKSAANFGYHQQAEWYLTGMEHTLGRRPERFAFVVVAKKPPFLVTVHWVDADALAWGAIQNRYARGVFAWCQRHNEWPGYVQQIGKPGEAFTLRLPGWKMRELEEKHAAGAFEPPTVNNERIAAE
jgi:hypothetical protein